MRFLSLHIVASVSILVSSSLAHAVYFGEILTFDPQTDPVNATFGVDLNNTQTWSGLHSKDEFDNSQPAIHWFKYTADGNSAVTFDTYGTNISSDGPDPDRSGFLTAGNATQIAVYDALGNLVARTGGVRDLNGDLVPEFPSAVDNPEDPNYYLRASAVELSELMFMQNAPGNPHWDTSPGAISDPLSPDDYEGLRIPGCSDCAYQTYSDGRNEYEVWRDSLQIVLDGGSFFRASDRYSTGPGSSWNRYNILPAGDYYVVVTGSPPSFSGDTYKEEFLMTPIHDGIDTSNPFNPVFVENVPIIDEPMGPFEIYMGKPNQTFPNAWGTIQLNVTHYALAIEGDLNGDGFVGLDDLDIVLNNWNQNVTAGDLLQGDPSGDGFVGLDDLDTILNNWNAGTPPAVEIPEPATFALSLLGGLALLRRNH